MTVLLQGHSVTWISLNFSTPGISGPDQFMFHTAVSNSTHLDQVFDNERLSSHFYLRPDVGTDQYVSLDREGWAAFYANRRCLMEETWDGYPRGWVNGNAPPWTAAALEELAQTLAAAHKQYPAIALRITPAYNQPGVTWHAQWSENNQSLHSCPTATRIAQIPSIIARAIEIVNGDDVVTQADIDAIAKAVWSADVVPARTGGPTWQASHALGDVLAHNEDQAKAAGDLTAAVGAVLTAVKALPAAVWEVRLPVTNADGSVRSTSPWSARAMLGRVLQTLWGVSDTTTQDLAVDQADVVLDTPPAPPPA